ncbi:MAG: nuclease-related domain-containing protein [Pseudomonadota bacterium]
MSTEWMGGEWTPEMTAAVALGVLLVVLVGLWIGRRRLLRRLEDRRNRRILRKLGRESLEHVAIPDGLGEQNLALDHVVLLPTGFLVVDVKDYAGVLFAGERIDEWTQTVGRRSYKFTNPIPANQLKIQALQDLFPEVPVHGRVVFTRQGRFATGLPWGACMLDEVGESVADLVTDEDVPGTYYAAWMRLERDVAIRL